MAKHPMQYCEDEEHRLVKCLLGVLCGGDGAIEDTLSSRPVEWIPGCHYQTSILVA
jgi:hypothetical protein